MADMRVDSARCKVCWNLEPDFRCPVPYEPLYEAFRAHQNIVFGPARKMDLPPCVAACPANICVQGYVGLIASGLYDEAYKLIRRRVPFPHALSLVCPHPCEGHCVRGDYDQPLAINSLKRFVVERASKKLRREFLNELRSSIVENGMEVAVVGAGPTGLTAAHDLRLRGYHVTVFEAEDLPGGMMLVGIPEFRLPRAVLKMEVEEILQLGIELKVGVRVGRDLSLKELLERYKAVFLAAGAHRGMKLMIPGEGAEGVLDALEFLREVNLGRKVRLGKRVVVIGGGDSAIDGARVALRMGAQDVLILYRRLMEEMPAHPEQLEQAIAEGVRVLEQVAPVRFINPNGRLSRVELIRTKPGAPDASGRRRPIPIPGSNFTVEADTAIVAIGQQADLKPLKGLGVRLDDQGFLQVDTNMMTSVEGLFAGGDLVSGPSTVIEAIASGKRAAWGIDRFLRGERAQEICFRTPDELVGMKRYRLRHVPIGRRPKLPQAPASDRVKDFQMVELTLTEEEACAEAWRCLACSMCASCNACVDTFACPAITPGLDGKITIDEELCNACGVCAQLCPNNAIKEEREPVGAR